MKAVFVDHHDSFADLIAYKFLEAEPQLDLKMFKSDCDLETIANQEPQLIILGPGPNGPKEAGNYLDVLEQYSQDYPIFGICLGFQAMMHYFGQEVVVLPEAVHGAESKIYHNGDRILAGLDPECSYFARYHSLGVYNVPAEFDALARTDDGTGRQIIMAAQHRSLPLAGVQFHPESFLSMEDDAGMKLIYNVLQKLRK